MTGAEAQLVRLMEQHPRWLVLTGAGVSTASGIPGYRGADGQWQRKPPITHQEFVASLGARQRYWARSMIGFGVMANAMPNAAHLALVQLEQSGRITQLVTQNVDGLHQRAGSADVNELHGSIRQVICQGCGAQTTRLALQARLASANPGFAPQGVAHTARPAPDGDFDLHPTDLDGFSVPACDACGGMLKPDVVFFGANVPRVRVDAALQALMDADALLVAGSSLMVYSGYRFCERAHAAGKPIAAINLGRTRADPLLSLKIESDCASMLARLAQHASATGRLAPILFRYA